MSLIGLISERRAHVAVIGLGYVGLPLALRAAEVGFEVVGIDTDPVRVSELNAGRSYIKDVPAEEVARQVSEGRLRASTEVTDLGPAEVVVICVPTPLKDDLPDTSHIESAARGLVEVLRPGRLVILESTSYPGTTETVVGGILESSGLRAGVDFFLGFSPERVDPGNPHFALSDLPKIVGGVDEAATDLMEAFYSQLVPKIVRVSSPQIAEMAKLLENTYRHVNIALINEIAILCHDLGIDVWEVIDAASTKPFGFQPFYPGPGWGGHCIPVDPAYLSWRVRQLGDTAHFVELAREINRRMPGYVVHRISEALNDEGKSLRGSTVLILGVTYKADVEDLRESPALDILARLRKAGASVAFHDPFVDSLPPEAGADPRVDDLDPALRGADIVVVATDHTSYDWGAVASAARLILDTRNALKGQTGPILKL
jgi:UDP-N-acetyl-D-glucosamine dehydrogenase